MRNHRRTVPSLPKTTAMLSSWRKMLSPHTSPSDSLLMALSSGSVCLEVLRLHSSLLLCTSFRCSRLTFCMVRQPLLFSMGRLQSQVIGEVVALVALLSGIALSSENTIRYGRHCRKIVISLRSPSLVLLVLGLPLLSPLTTVSSGGYNIADTIEWQFLPRPLPSSCFLMIGWLFLSCLCAWQLGWVS